MLFFCFFSFQCGRSFDPRFLFTWPTARVAMDTAEDMADVCCGEVRIMYPMYCPVCEPTLCHRIPFSLLFDMKKLGKLFLSTEVEGFKRWVTGRPVASLAIYSVMSKSHVGLE